MSWQTLCILWRLCGRQRLRSGSSPVKGASRMARNRKNLLKDLYLELLQSTVEHGLEHGSSPKPQNHRTLGTFPSHSSPLSGASGKRGRVTPLQFRSFQKMSLSCSGKTCLRARKEALRCPFLCAQALRTSVSTGAVRRF